MRVLAVLAVRNEMRYLARCLDHFESQGCEVAVIDHASSDGSRELVAARLGGSVVRLDDQPWTGSFALVDQLRWKERVIDEERADWYVHLDADEIKHAPARWTNLHDAFADVGEAGWNAIDFDEFVFVPTQEDPDFEGCDFVADMRWYYHYEPDTPDRSRVNAWRRIEGVRPDLVAFGGHHVMFPGIRVFPQPFVLRHYPVLSVRHAAEKYGGRVFASAELENAWHGDRAAFSTDRMHLPARASLREEVHGEELDASECWNRHPFLDSGAGPIRRQRPPDPERPARLGRLRAYADGNRQHIPRITPRPTTGSDVQPLWTVALPVHNPRPDHLRSALRSVLDQDPGPRTMEVIVVDDASTSVDVRVLVESIATDRVRYVRNDVPLGLAGNWNRCIELAAGQLVHLLHQDDRVLPGFYDRLGRPFAQRSDLVGAFCRTSGVDDDGNVLWTQLPDGVDPGIIGDLVVREAELHRMHCPAVVVRRSTYVELGGYRTDMAYCTDWDFMKRMASLGPVWHEPLALAHWRVHSGQTTTALTRSGQDLAERERSIEDSMSFLPAETIRRVRSLAMRASLVASLDMARRHLSTGDRAAALAQTRQIVSVLERGTPAVTNERTGVDSELAEARKHIERLEAQIKGWTHALVAARAPHSFAP